MVRDALIHRLSHDESSPKMNPEDEESVYLSLRQSRFHAVLAAAASLPDNLDMKLRERELVQNVILAHHAGICMFLVIRDNCVNNYYMQVDPHAQLG